MKGTIITHNTNTKLILILIYRNRIIQNAKLERNNGQPLKKQKMIKKRIDSDDEDEIISISDESPEPKNDRRYSKLHNSFLEGIYHTHNTTTMLILC